jgi:hypothetical protein
VASSKGSKQPTVGGQLQHLPLRDLLLDPQNPRLPRDVRGTTDQAELAKYIARRYNAIEVARSIASNGFFESEPLIAIAEGNTWRVVEGNRRLTALKGLAESELREGFTNAREWKRLADKAPVPDRIPVVVAAQEKDIWPIIGYRHISGIEPWDPYAKAQFIADRVDSDVSWEEVAILVGESESSVRAHYRNFKVNEQARDDFGIDVSEVEEQFGTFTRAMQSQSVRSYIKAPAPRDVERRKPLLPSTKKKNTKELLSWVFGVDGKEAVIEESRDLQELGIVLQDKDATAILKETRDLTEAYLVSPGQRDELAKRLKQAEALLRTTRDEVEGQKDDPIIINLVADCAKAARALTKAIK